MKYKIKGSKEKNSLGNTEKWAASEVYAVNSAWEGEEKVLEKYIS